VNCQTLISNMGFDCQNLGRNTLRLWSPFTYGNDGQVIGLFIESVSGGFHITDNAESLMHAASMGIQISKSKLESLRRACGDFVNVSDGGEISIFVDKEQITEGVASVLNAAMAVSHFEFFWTPRNKTESFTTLVANTLEDQLGGRLHRKVSVSGASGHQIEIPMAIQTTENYTYIQTVSSSDENHVDWQSVYAGFGKMMDLKNAGAVDESRIVVIDDSSNDIEVPKAISYLANCASVVRYSNLRGWAQRLNNPIDR